jgi:bifunctional UDP-N-acetylglucosamine pyrophosphorylase/glucosamine-1-phosphate N-acetyltransferase
LATSTEKRTRTLAAVVLAAGKGKRLKSNTPKVLHQLCGRPVLWHVLRAVDACRPGALIVVVGNGREQVEDAVRGFGLRAGLTFVDQGQLLGTGHAVMVAEAATSGFADVLVAPGDEPLLTHDQLRSLLAIHRRRDVAAVVQTTIPHDPRGFARLIRDARGEFVRLAEGSDATAEELVITEVATSVYAFRREDLYKALPLVGRQNRQREYYLPDVLGILKGKGERVAVQLVDNGGSVGVNSHDEMAQASAVMRRRINDRHMAAGVSLVDPATAYIDVDVRIGRDSVIRPLTFLQGSARIGEGCSVGPVTCVVDSAIGDGAEVTFSVVRESRIGRRVSVGPYASVRPGTVLMDDAKAGSFVEIKASRVGRGSKVPHLSYVGDATIGQDVNIGAGVVTVNYDGFAKHRTVIMDEVHIGSDNMLVAPVKIGKRAWTGAGSVITKDVPAGALAVERTEQRIVRGYDERTRARHATGQGKKGSADSTRKKGERRG